MPATNLLRTTTGALCHCWVHTAGTPCTESNLLLLHVRTCTAGKKRLLGERPRPAAIARRTSRLNCFAGNFEGKPLSACVHDIRVLKAWLSSQIVEACYLSSASMLHSARNCDLRRPSGFDAFHASTLHVLGLGPFGIPLRT